MFSRLLSTFIARPTSPSSMTAARAKAEKIIDENGVGKSASTLLFPFPLRKAYARKQKLMEILMLKINISSCILEVILSLLRGKQVSAKQVQGQLFCVGVGSSWYVSLSLSLVHSTLFFPNS